jgi:hypothetical protein
MGDRKKFGRRITTLRTQTMSCNLTDISKWMLGS